MPHPVDIHVGRRVRECRMALGMSQIELASKLGISFQQVQKYESGANRVGSSRLWEISCILGVEAQAFFEGLERKPVDHGRVRAGLAEAPMADYDPGEPWGRETLALARAINNLDNTEVRQEIARMIKTLARNTKTDDN